MISLDTDLPLNQRAHRLIRHDILMGVLKPESRLKTEELQKRYGLSSTPLREALSRLTQEGLVTADDRKGVRVTPLSAKDFEEIVQMRLLVETAALRSSIENGNADWEANAVSVHYRLHKIETDQGAGSVLLSDEWEDWHRRFHFALLSACNNERQKAICADLFDQAERYRRVSGRARRSMRTVQEHQSLLDAALARDADTAVALLESHITTTFENVQHALALPNPV